MSKAFFIGKIPYEKWRDFDSERRVEPHKYFIDGDLIETFLELPYTEASNLIKDFKVKIMFWYGTFKFKIISNFNLDWQFNRGSLERGIQCKLFQQTSRRIESYTLI